MARVGPVLPHLTALKGVKSAVGTDVRHLELFGFPTEPSGPVPTLPAFADDEWSLTVTSPSSVNVNIPSPLPSMSFFDTVQYDLGLSGDWQNGTTYNFQSLNLDFSIAGLGPLPVPIRIRYVTLSGEISFPSNSKLFIPIS